MEGSGDSVKYYAQLGADSASKKLLGSQIHYVEGIPNNSTYTFDYTPRFILFNWTGYDIVFRYLIVETGKTNGYDCNITKISDTKYSVFTNGQGTDKTRPFNLIWF